MQNNTFESRRRLEKMPFDKCFDVDGNSERKCERCIHKKRSEK